MLLDTDPPHTDRQRRLRRERAGHNSAISPATYYRWRARAEGGRLADDPHAVCRLSVPPTLEERAAVCDFARAHPLMGYKRLTWDMVDQDIAYLRPGQVYQVLQQRQPARAPSAACA